MDIGKELRELDVVLEPEIPESEETPCEPEQTPESEPCEVGS